MFGYLFRAHADGWRAFCDRLGIDTSALERLMPGVAAIEAAADLAGRVAFTAEEALAYARRAEPGAAAVPTADSVADELRELITDAWRIKAPKRVLAAFEKAESQARPR